MSNSPLLSNQELKLFADGIRVLSAQMVEKANSGHPGMPLGFADVMSVLFGNYLKFDSKHPHWINRDRFVLSAGHGCAALYSAWYMVGMKGCDLNQIMHFRQAGYKMAGHPEVDLLDCVEVTTGPLGQGFANAVGLAVAGKHLETRFNDELMNHYTYVAVGDGCLMEGISQEAGAIAGHLSLGNLICFYDFNGITIDGKLSIADSTDTAKRFESIGWHVVSIDGHDYDQINSAILESQNDPRPSMIICKTQIGFGTKNKVDTEKVHGSPLGKENLDHLKKSLGYESIGAFELSPECQAVCKKVIKNTKDNYKKWHDLAENYEHKDELSAVIKKDFRNDIVKILDGEMLNIFNAEEKGATRKLFSNVLDVVLQNVRRMIVGSADLSNSCYTKTPNTKDITKDDFSGNYLNYGVREHGMAAIVNGIASHGGTIPLCSTFLSFADYMKPSLRLASLMKLKAIFAFTHDSIYVGEDGPTHQPIEQLGMLRSIPGLQVFRPCDGIEVSECLSIALSTPHAPSAFALSRQELPMSRNSYSKKSMSSYGAYIIRADESNPDVVLCASGSEVSMALEIRKILHKSGVAVRIVSVPCVELFEFQSDAYKLSVLGDYNISRVFIEASNCTRFLKYIRPDIDLVFNIDQFGVSGKAADVAHHLHFTPDVIAHKIVDHKKNLDENLIEIYNRFEKRQFADDTVYSV